MASKSLKTTGQGFATTEPGLEAQQARIALLEALARLQAARIEEREAAEGFAAALIACRRAGVTLRELGELTGYGQRRLIQLTNPDGDR